MPSDVAVATESDKKRKTTGDIIDPSQADFPPVKVAKMLAQSNENVMQCGHTCCMSADPSLRGCLDEHAMSDFAEVTWMPWQNDGEDYEDETGDQAPVAK